MATVFSTSGENSDNIVVPTPQLQGFFIPGIDNNLAVDGFGIVTPWGGGRTTRRYGDYGIPTEVSQQSTQLYDLASSLIPAEGGISYNFEGLKGDKGDPGRDGVDGIIHVMGLGLPINSNFLAALPHNIDQINDLGTAVDKLIYTDTYTTTFIGIGSDDLVSGTTDGDTLPEPWPPDEPEEREISLGDGVELTEGTMYAIVARAPDASGSGNAGLWEMKGSGAYSDGAQYYSTDGGSTWEVNSSADVWFQTKASGVVKDSYTFASAGSGAWLYGSSYWTAQTFIATSTYTITSVNVKLYRASGASPGTITVGIRSAESYSEATWAESALTSAGRALLDDSDSAAQATTLGLGTGDSPTWTGATLSDLTASRLVWGDGSKALASKDLVDLIAGTENRVTITDDAGGGVIINTPQDTHVDAHMELAGLTIKNEAGNIIFYVDNDEVYFTVTAAIEIATGMPIGLLLTLTYNLD